MSISGQLKRIEQRIRHKAHSAVQQIARDVIQETKDKLREITERDWYNAYSPKDYTRTYQLLNSIVGTVTHNGLTYTLEVYLDVDLIEPAYGSGWNQHSGFNRERFVERLISSIEHGMQGSVYNPRYGEAAHMIEKTQKWANDYANKIFKQRLQELFAE